MRKKLYYTADEITVDLYTAGSEWMTIDAKEYIGPYHTYNTGEVYTGTTWNSKTSNQLVKYVVESTTVTEYRKTKNINVKYDSPKNGIIQITPTDLKNGFVQRYFIKKLNESNITEIDSIEFSKYESGKFDPLLYSGITLKWMISGNLDDDISTGVFKRGVITTNRLTTVAAEKQLPGMLTKLSNYTEYYSSTDVVIPADIN